jgi:hypothetical protein
LILENIFDAWINPFPQVVVPSRKVVVFFLLACLGIPSWAQQALLSGQVSDATTGTTLPGCTIFVKHLNKGTTSRTDGTFQLPVPAGKHTVIFSFVGYTPDTIVVSVHEALTLNVKLFTLSTLLSEVVVADVAPDAALTSTESGHITLTRKEIERLPYLLGEVDPIRLLQLMPGVHTSGEGSTGFYVRGGAVDQNLLLLDNATVYNPSHLFGFFSIFNGTAVEGIDMYKGGIPAYYGGRLSSVTRVSTRSGNDQELKGEGSIGLVAANIMVEGPLRKNKGSFLVSARRTYVDLFARGLHEINLLKRNIDYYFYDLNANLDWRVSTRDRISIRSYYGNDDFDYNTKASFSNSIAWRNRTASLSWQHNFSENLYADLSLQGSGYDMKLGVDINSYAINIASDLNDVGFTYQFGLKKNKHDLAWGVTYVRHNLRPNNMNAASEDVALNVGPTVKLKADEAALFVNDKISFNERTELSVGVRLSGYSQLGALTRYIEDESFQILDTVVYGTNERIQNYGNIEPRASLRYSISRSSSLKLSYDKTVQYMHMAPLSSVSLPLDIWVPSSTVIKPQQAHQVSAGYFKNFKDNAWETSVVLYYKAMQRQIEYREGVVIGYSKGHNFDDNFVFGKGKSYGAEFSIKKSQGKLNGQLSYTLSRTTRTFDELNDGKPFAAKYDRLHDLSIVTNYDYNPRWTFSCVFVYGTGNALNLPVARYVIQGNVINEYGARNSFRMPAYHRLDVSVTYAARKTARFESYWILSFYNVYSRKNPYYIYFETEGDLENFELKTSIRQVSIFPIIPAITYRFKF